MRGHTWQLLRKGKVKMNKKANIFLLMAALSVVLVFVVESIYDYRSVGKVPWRDVLLPVCILINLGLVYRASKEKPN